MTYGTLAIDTINTSSKLTVLGSLIASNMQGRNRIINGNMAIDQRNAGANQTITSGAALAYTVDRWYAYCTGANVTGHQTTGAGPVESPSQYVYEFTGAASVTGIGFAQRIEATNCFDLAGNTATLSVNLSNSLLASVTWTAYYATTADTFGTLASPTKTQIATGTIAVTSTVANYSVTIDIPSAATTGIEIVFSVGAQTSGTWTIGNVQLELGTANTPFERLSYAQNLVLCQRYYEKSYDYATLAGASSQLGSAGNTTGGTGYYMHSTKFSVGKRVTPTVTIYATTGTSGKIRNVSVNAEYAASAGGVGQSGFFVQVNTGANNNWALYQFVAVSEL